MKIAKAKYFTNDFTTDKKKNCCCNKSAGTSIMSWRHAGSFSKVIQYFYSMIGQFGMSLSNIMTCNLILNNTGNGFPA